ncbi:MAG: class I SAM-dependent methyltransferase [Gammaproteobacteria bacterium]
MLDSVRCDEIKSAQTRRDFVPESRFGFWFLGTDIWERHVIQYSLDDLGSLISEPWEAYPVILDAGCGQGRSFHLLNAKFHPQRLIGVDAEVHGLVRARQAALRYGVQAELLRGDCSALPLPDACVDLVFCHQTFHHLVHQEQALAEFYRVLKPGGLLLFAESTREYINTWFIYFLFRHPMEVQRSAEEYLDMIRRVGFAFGERNVLFPYLWWSRTTLRGVLELLHLRRAPPPGQRKETLVYMVGTKPI